MPYEAMEPTMNPTMKSGMKASRFESTEDCLNKIVTAFKAYDMWCGEAEKCAVKHDFRGLGRFDERMGKRAHCDAADFGKKVADHPYGVITMPIWDVIAKAGETAYYKKADLPRHMAKWSENLHEMRDLFTHAAYYLSDCKEITLYRELCCYVKQIENEIWAVNVVIDRVTPDDYQHPDSKQVFKKLHTYFKDEYDGGDIDFDL